MPQPGAPCGLVDTLDFPLDPPDAAALAFAGRDFGVYRDRYEKYHAGEDWWLSRGRSNFGQPVYSIGHGQVTYAEPLGWGRDQGVVIIRHTFATGETLLSFYGHLDPEGFTLAAGDCVIRGEQVGKIGKPRTPPHLHFEIRTQQPFSPLTGYWPEDPMLAGWLPPSQTIWHARMAGAPGVGWARPFSPERRQVIGVIDPDTIVLVESDALLGLDAADGSERWRAEMEEPVNSALITGGQIITADRHGQITALTLADSGVPETEPAWTVKTDLIGSSLMMPLPSGGLALAVRQQILGLAADGRLLWSASLAGRPYDWVVFNHQLVLSTAGSGGGLVQIDEKGVSSWPGAGVANGRLAVIGSQLWLYDEEGLFRLEPNTGNITALVSLPRSFLGLGAIIALPGGGALVAHRDRADQRLLWLDQDGRLLWERSIAGLIDGSPDLLVWQGMVFLASWGGTSGTDELKLYRIDFESESLIHLFTGGTRAARPEENWITVDNKSILVQIGGGSLVSLDPAAAEIGSLSP